MKTIVAGSRSFTDYEQLRLIFEYDVGDPSVIISGGAQGVDALGERWAKINDVPLIVMKADWDTYGKAAGFIRNKEMAKIADRLVALWDGKSKGTKHMIDTALAERLEVHVFFVN